MTAKQAVSSLTETLPLRLRNFFARYPPQFYSTASIPKPTPPADLSSSAAPSPYTPFRASKASRIAEKESFSITESILRSNAEYPNPFLPFQNPETGRWRGAVISLRQQNDLVKLARAHGVEELLPPGRKSTEYREARVAEKGLRIKGTGIGQKVKGHKWERTMKGRLEERKKAMMEMPEMIRLWKQRGHGRGWKKYPKK
ncbi:54S ribosomal protein L25, mitochondrial [Ophidiomyces ophidiicola]|nr:54S ribosomal protein L25, mitochondrial [Ophidiomyces ophidiicola]